MNKYTSVFGEREWWGKKESLQYTPDMDAEAIYNDLMGWVKDNADWFLETDARWLLRLLKKNEQEEKIRADFGEALGLIVSPSDWGTFKRDLIKVIEEKEEE